MNSKKSSSRSSKKRVSRAPARSSLAPQLAAYSATSLAALALAPVAHAQIIPITSFNYSSLTNTATPPHLPNGSASTLAFTAGPLNGHLKINGSSSSAGLFIKGSIATSGGSYHIKRLALGSLLTGKNLQFNNNTDLLAVRNPSNKFGQFLPGSASGHVTGYFGFEAHNLGHTYYGWLKADVGNNVNNYPDYVALIAKSGSPGIFGAYDISTDKNIGSFKAGDVASVPEPSEAAFGLGLLAFGAAGVRELRKRRKMVA